jgi:hypothetical protein
MMFLIVRFAAFLLIFHHHSAEGSFVIDGEVSKAIENDEGENREEKQSLAGPAVEEEFDYLVIGAGSGGKASARMARELGARAALIEGGPLGGTCVNAGCIPKKSLWYAAQHANALKEHADFGFSLRSSKRTRRGGRPSFSKQNVPWNDAVHFRLVLVL